MNKDLKPTKSEKEFLTLAYNRFYDIYDEVTSDSFFKKKKSYRFSKIKEGFAVYVELLHYEPLRWVVEHVMEKLRPPMESEIGSNLFKFIRNVVFHFPFFETWDDVWVNKSIVNWHKEGQSIDNFLKKHEGHDVIKYRFWESSKKKMTYLEINFPKFYNQDMKVYLKEILSERDGVKFSFILMKSILNTQVEK